ncbi:alpha/beta hydrolase [Leptobacterium flavescens]|uniref:Alpha/beta hydrolase n=1 Tax=Leptobacterium flavescens TaxID=472055 RepID=A0A6P0UK84_9FLAO|nr:alpha/beta hydrolase [Leptobacterium flavescens]NER12279.1 alpha/beta hydrolase [Leptobacterium flavescens]
MKKLNLTITLLLSLFVLQAQETISEEILLMNGKIELPGTLSYQEAAEPIPLIVFIQGSGNTDRNGNQPGTVIQANYIKQLADTLNANGIAFYRFDKRSSNPKNREHILKKIAFDDLVQDAKICIGHFKGDKRFSKIVVMGHSQGSLTGMLALDDSVHSYVSLSGLSETMEKAVIRQISAQSDELAKTAEAHFKELRETDTIKEVNQFLIGIFNPRNHDFIKSYNALNPVEEIKKVKVPTLIINGESDLQVRPEDAKALHTARGEAELVIIPKMNHLLKEVNTREENQASYISDKYPLSDELIKTLIAFIKN